MLVLDFIAGWTIELRGGWGGGRMVVKYYDDYIMK